MDTLFKKLINGLLKFGLSEKEAKLYITACKENIATIQKLSNISGLNRVSTYGYVDSLIKKGLLTEVKKDGRKFYSAENPEKFFLILQQEKWKMKDLNNSIDLLIEAINQITPLKKEFFKPEIRYYEDMEGIRIVYNEVLKNKEIFAYFSSKVFEMFPENVQKFAKAVKDNRIVLKEIVDDSSASRNYIKTVNNRLHKVRFLPKKKYIEIDYMIYGDFLTFIDFEGTPPVSIIIRQKDIAETAKVMFKILWDSLKPIT